MPTILIVEDNPDIQHLLRHIVEAAGHTARTAGDGDAALELAATNSYDLALLDIRMPGMSGTELCRRLREGESRRRLPIIMVTAHASSTEIDAAYSAGADDYVVKPFSPRDLTVRIEAALAKASRESWSPSLGLLATVATRAAHGSRAAPQGERPSKQTRTAAG